MTTPIASSVPMKKVRVSALNPRMLVREDDPTAGYLIGMEAVNVARAINSHDALVAALTELHARLKTTIDENGGCDHSVGICWCEEVREIDRAEAALASVRNGAKTMTTPDARVSDERLRERVFGTGDSLRDADWILALGHAAKEVEPDIDYVPCVPDPQVIAGWLRALRELSLLRAQGQGTHAPQSQADLIPTERIVQGLTLLEIAANKNEWNGELAWIRRAQRRLTGEDGYAPLPAPPKPAEGV